MQAVAEQSPALTPVPITLPAPPATVHFIGIGGISMSGIARMLLDQGYSVTGSDIARSAQTQALEDRGAKIMLGHSDPELAGSADVVVSTRRAELHAETELSAARAHGALVVKRGQLLGMIANAKRSVAIAGTHGKSTTTGMVAHALAAMGADPSYASGAVIPSLGGTTGSGSGPFMAVEADEFDRSFYWLRPEVAIITSVSFDHPDIYASQDDYDDAFRTFAGGVTPDGTLIIAGDDLGSTRVLQTLNEHENPPFNVVTFGEGAAVHWKLDWDGRRCAFVDPGKERHTVQLGVPGKHNARNAIAATAALAALGFRVPETIAAIETFTGVGRRFEHKGTIAGVDVVDDYAHHPDEIAAVLAAARDTFLDRRIIAVHQPHTYSRTKALLEEFAVSLDDADEIVLLDIYPSGEQDTLGISSSDILAKLRKPSHAASGPNDAARITATIMRPGDVVLTLGAGDITRTGSLLIEALTRRQEGEEQVANAHPRVMSPESAPRSRRNTTPSFDLPGAPDVRVLEGASMAMFTTMRLGGNADFLVRAQNPDHLVEAVRWANAEGMRVTVIGGGSNLLVSDDGIRGLVIVVRTPGERARELLEAEDRDDHVQVRVAVQAPLSWVGRYCAEQGWSGMDWGVGLPGQIGGATVNNAGAHGTELKDHLTAIDILSSTGEIERKPASWLDPAYRVTKVKDAPRPRPWIILASIFDLPKDDPGTLVALANDHAEFRKRTQPTGACSGSTFANPPGDFAGRLLEAAGLKGHTVGAMRLSPKHANWVVNTGGGTASEAWELIQFARATVASRFGVDLRPEIERVGEGVESGARP